MGMVSQFLGPHNPIEQRIFLVRGLRVMLDSDLAVVYGVSTKRLNEQVSRNQGRFPSAFMFHLTKKEKAEVVAECDHLRHLRFSPHQPRVFTEHGVIMLASVLKSKVAIRASIEVVKAFIRLREMLFTNETLGRRLDELEKRYDGQFRTVFEAIRELMELPEKPPKQIGFRL